MTSIVMSLATLLSVLFLVYAFVQKLEADKQKEIAIKSRLFLLALPSYPYRINPQEKTGYR